MADLFWATFVQPATERLHEVKRSNKELAEGVSSFIEIVLMKIIFCLDRNVSLAVHYGCKVHVPITSESFTRKNPDSLS